MSERLTGRDLRAIAEALNMRLAGEIEDVGDLTVADYRRALRRIIANLSKHYRSPAESPPT